MNFKNQCFRRLPVAGRRSLEKHLLLFTYLLQRFSYEIMAHYSIAFLKLQAFSLRTNIFFLSGETRNANRSFAEEKVKEEENEKETDFYNDTCRTCLDIVQ